MTLRAPGVARVGLGRRPRVLQRIQRSRRGRALHVLMVYEPRAVATGPLATKSDTTGQFAR